VYLAVRPVRLLVRVWEAGTVRSSGLPLVVEQALQSVAAKIIRRHVRERMGIVMIGANMKAADMKMRDAIIAMKKLIGVIEATEVIVEIAVMSAVDVKTNVRKI
jgi:hypothetical protein